MTVTYTYKVANARLCGFTRLLFYWKGSIYKIMYKEMLIYLACYLALSVLYRFALDTIQRSIFERVVLFCQEFTNLIPLSFVLGFYVALVVGRWWNQYLNIPWPDKVMINVASLLHGVDDRSRMMRRTIVRYINLASILLFRAVSVSVAKRFPSMEHIVDAGMMTEDEKRIFEDLPSVHSKYWVPIQWAINVASQARNEGRIKDDIHLKTIIDEINAFRSCCGTIYSYDWISIPLVYTQTTTLAVYTYFFASVVGSQYLDPAKKYPGHEVDLYIPVFNVLQFFFYMGWIKVAEQLINPFGEDDDDFETNYVIDRNIQVAFMCVDEMYMSYPELQKDAFWDDAEATLPYTKSSANTQRAPILGSTANLHFDYQDTQFVCSMDTIAERRAPEISTLATILPFGLKSNSGSPKKPCSRLITNLNESTRMSPFFSRRDEPTKGTVEDKVDLSSSIASNLRDHWLQVPGAPQSSPYSTGFVNSPSTPRSSRYSTGYVNSLAQQDVGYVTSFDNGIHQSSHQPTGHVYNPVHSDVHYSTPPDNSSKLIRSNTEFINNRTNQDVGFSVSPVEGYQSPHCTTGSVNDCNKEADNSIHPDAFSYERSKTFVVDANSSPAEFSSETNDPALPSDHDKKVTFKTDNGKPVDCEFKQSTESLAMSDDSNTCKIQVEINSDGEEIYLPIGNSRNDTVNSLTPLLDSDTSD